MKSVLPVLAAALVCSMSGLAKAADTGDAEVWRTAMQSARWTGPMVAATAETLPKGHVYTEPYFFDAISGGKSHFGSTGFYNYGLLDSFTVGLSPNFAFETHGSERGFAVGDIKLLSTVRLTHFTAEHRFPTIAILLNATLPTGSYQRLREGEVGHGSGSFAPELGVNAQQYFLLKNGRLLRGRINLLKTFPRRASLTDMSVYGTAEGFRGHAKPGSKTQAIVAVEYSLTQEWVVALDLIHTASGKTRVYGSNEGGSAFDQLFPSSHSTGFAPAVEYNWSDRGGALFGVWVTPKGHNSSFSIIPAIAIQRFW